MCNFSQWYNGYTTIGIWLSLDTLVKEIKGINTMPKCCICVKYFKYSWRTFSHEDYSCSFSGNFQEANVLRSFSVISKFALRTASESRQTSSYDRYVLSRSDFITPIMWTLPCQVVSGKQTAWFWFGWYGIYDWIKSLYRRLIQFLSSERMHRCVSLMFAFY